MASLETARRILALAELPGVGRITVRRIIAGLGGPGALAGATTVQLTLLARAIVGKRARIGDDDLAAGLVDADRQLAAVAQAGNQVVTPACAAWPGQLDRLDGDAPLLLYVRGDPAALAARAVAVVGTRQPTAFGLACARRFGQRVAEAGCTVVSGLALGCDTAGHEGCLEAQGRTVAVLPGPVDRIIPYGNRHLATRITTQGGCLASEYPNDGLNPHDEVPVHQFVARDRIQAGLSRGVLVVETGAEDGTMHTVHAAQRMAVPIACLMRDDPAWLAAPGTAGNRQLVEAGQAAPLRTAEDLRAWLGQV